MTKEKAKEMTTSIFLGDTILNWFLGAVLTFLPGLVDNLIGIQPVFPALVYQVIGILFLFYAAWQSWAIWQKKVTGPISMIYAALMALVPVVLLAAALLFMHLPLKPLWRIILWIGDIYMLFLGAWYLYIARLSE